MRSRRPRIGPSAAASQAAEAAQRHWRSWLKDLQLGDEVVTILSASILLCTTIVLSFWEWVLLKRISGCEAPAMQLSLHSLSGRAPLLMMDLRNPNADLTAPKADKERPDRDHANVCSMIRCRQMQACGTSGCKMYCVQGRGPVARLLSVNF